MAGSVAELIEQLPSRFKRDAASPLCARVRLNISRTTRDVVVTPKECAVEPATGAADVEICTTAPTWRAMDEGRISGIEAFLQRKVSVRGSIEKALLFEPLFERPDTGGLRYSIERIRVGQLSFSTLIAGPEDAPPLVLLHGLGATKGSWLTVIPTLARRFRVLAPDIPGFGASSKPLARYDARWFATKLRGFVSACGYDSSFVAGNSMGGRIAMEMAMLDPEHVDGIACLCPATAFTKRPLLQVARLARAELGIMVSRLPRAGLRDGLRQLFTDPSRLEDVWYDAAIDDFLEVWKSPRARLAFFSAARNIYLEEPYGENGFWSRLSQMETPALYIFGRQDVLITARFASQVKSTLPSADVRVWTDCGHVPQLEWPDRTADALTDFFSTATARSRVAV